MSRIRAWGRLANRAPVYSVPMSAQIENVKFKGVDAIRLSTPAGAKAVISLLGGQVLSWVPPRGKEWLFLSEKADYSGARAIRGGAPVCFPQFADQGPLPKHGLVRTKPWKLVNQRSSKDFAMVVLGLEDDEETRALWPYSFYAEMAIGIEEGRLDMELEINNTGSESFEFTAALHTYLRVSQVEESAIQGLRGLGYCDKADFGTLKRESADEVQVESEVDRVYYNAPPTLLLGDSRRNLAIGSENFPDVVVWNPWEEKGAALPDMAPQDFRHMLCIEAACVGKPVILPAGESWWGRQTLADMGSAEG